MFDVLKLRLKLKNSDWVIRSRAAESLGDLEGAADGAVQALIAALHDPNKDVRGSAASALGKIASEVSERGPSPMSLKVMHCLIEATLNDSDSYVRSQAAIALGRPGWYRGTHADTESGEIDWRPPNWRPPNVLVAALSNKESRDRATRALEKIGRFSIEALDTTFGSQDPEVRKAVVKALGGIRERGTLDTLLDALKDCDADVRRQSAEALQYKTAELQDIDHPLRHRLLPLGYALTHDGDPFVRRCAAVALGGAARVLGDPDNASARNWLADALKDTDGNVRRVAGDALAGRLGSGSVRLGSSWD
jgi:HEAT repeat protein